MLNGRIYRAAFVPLLLALAIAGFSLTGRVRPLSSTLAPDAFDGPRAYAGLQSLAARFPDRRPGSRGDEALAADVEQTLRGLGASAGGGFSVHVRRFDAQTIDGERTLENVVAERPGTTGKAPLVILAHRDAAAHGAAAALSGTAVLLELARVFAVSQTERSVILVSTSGGSGGAAGAADFAAHALAAPDAALVLGDLAGTRASKPFVLPFSAGLGSAPERLQRTVAAAIAQEVGVDPGAPGTLSQLAHLSFPLAPTEQGPLDAAGIPAVLVQVSGERGPAAREPVSSRRLQNFGRAVLSAVYALDGGPDVPAAAQSGLQLQRKLIPIWALRLLVAALLLPPLLCAVDGLARLRRRREPVARWALWALACALPFLAASLFALALGTLGVLPAPRAVLPRGALALDGAALARVLAVVLVLALGWVAWPRVIARAGLRARADSDAAAIALLLLLGAVASVAWLSNPYVALLLVPALHLWLLLLVPERLPAAAPARRAVALGLVALGLLPLVALLAYYARELGYGPGALAQALVTLVAGGRFGMLGLLLWSLALGCGAAALLVALGPSTPPLPGGLPHDGSDPEEITIRGPLSYAGPGSLGGTESALRR